MSDDAFKPTRDQLYRAMDALLDSVDQRSNSKLEEFLPEFGIGENAALNLMAPLVVGGSAKLSNPTAFAHMDPPTPWITWVSACWNAALNQNLLHPDVSPAAQHIEQRVIDWIKPFFGMTGGHMTPGSTISNLTALWAARDSKRIKRVYASEMAHLSIRKSARILGLELITLPCNAQGQLDVNALPKNLDDAALVLTAGTTSEGAIDSFEPIGNAAWTHIDAAWAGPLRFSNTHKHKLSGIESADSVCVSAHKWLFQPKESGVLLFKDYETIRQVLSIDGAYLATPNVGVLGSRGANAVPLLATLFAWGRSGLEQRIDKAMHNAEKLHLHLQQHDAIQLRGENHSGVILWKHKTRESVSALQRALPVGCASLTSINGVNWIRHVSANPLVQMNAVSDAIDLALAQTK
jgi:L-2,4-diaminobutyrate decarboxylase